VSERVPGLGAVVLAGGFSTRMGRDKASLPFGGEPMLARVLRALADACAEVVIVSRRGQELPPPPLLPPDTTLVHAHDEVEGRGPLAGLWAGLAASRAERVYASSCDVPFLSPDFVRAVDAALLTRDVAIPIVDGRHHPLAAVYRRAAALPAIGDLLAQDRLRPVFLLERLSHAELSPAALEVADPGLSSLENGNTPDDLARLLARREERRVVVELYGVAARRAGRAEVEVEGRTLKEALADLGRRVPALEGEVVRRGGLGPHWIASLDGRRFTDDVGAPLAPGARVLLLSSLAGG
jgi:molybdopterin-guanine dinucleotide biosynthesis protein A